MPAAGQPDGFPCRWPTGRSPGRQQRRPGNPNRSRNETVVRVLANHARLSRMLASLVLAAGLTGLLAPAASAATSTSMPGMDGWIRLAHLSPNTPAVDV